MKTLGQYITNNCSIAPCVENAIQQMWSAFYANNCFGLVASSDKAKQNFIQSSLMSICTWRWARWPYNKATATRLDSVQNNFVQLLFPVTQQAGETADKYFARKRLQAGRRSARIGRWSSFWAGAIKAWSSHMKCERNCSAWSTQINQYIGKDFLENKRLHLSRGDAFTRTGTRSQSGHVHCRWHDGLEAAKAVASANPSSPSKSRFFGS